MSDWSDDCMHWHRRLLTGKFRHWCPDWDFLPVDETTPGEFESCCCFSRRELEAGAPDIVVDVA